MEGGSPSCGESVSSTLLALSGSDMEGVIVQLYAVRLHVRNIDIAKQWPDITCERNLGHNVLLPTGNAECEICKQNIKTKLYLLGCASRFELRYCSGRRLHD